MLQCFLCVILLSREHSFPLGKLAFPDNAKCDPETLIKHFIYEVFWGIFCEKFFKAYKKYYVCNVFLISFHHVGKPSFPFGKQAFPDNGKAFPKGIFLHKGGIL